MAKKTIHPKGIAVDLGGAIRRNTTRLFGSKWSEPTPAHGAKRARMATVHHIGVARICDPFNPPI